MIISRQKPLNDILHLLDGLTRIFLVGCAKCATVCKSGGEEEVWQMQEALASAGKDITGSIVIDEACHMLRVQRDFRAKQALLEGAEAILAMACGAGVQSVAGAAAVPTVAALDTLFLGNIRRFGHFEQRCSLCGDCMLSATGGLCPVTLCPKGLLNGPCGGMDNGTCEVDAEKDCAWCLIYRMAGADAPAVTTTNPPKDHAKMLKPATLKVPR